MALPVPHGREVDSNGIWMERVPAGAETVVIAFAVTQTIATVVVRPGANRLRVLPF